MKITFRKILLWGVAAAVVGSGIWYSMQEQPVPVDLATVSSGPMEVTIDVDGVTRIRNEFAVVAPVSGTVLRSPVAVGDAVVGGQTLVASIEPMQSAILDYRSRLEAEAAVKEAEAALRLAEANIGQAEGNWSYARDNYQRLQTLFDGGTVTKSQLDDSKLAMDQARSNLTLVLSERALRQATLDRAKVALVEPESNGNSSTAIKVMAPVDGNVLSVSSMSEHIVIAGAPLVTVGRPNDLELVVEMLSSDAVRIREGASAIVERWGGDNALAATVRRIEPSAFTKISALGIEEQRVRVLLDLSTPPEDRPGLGDNFRVYVRITEWRNEDAVQVPISALFRRGDTWQVFTAEGDLAHLTTVEIGQRNTLMAEVLSGLSVGDQVITHPSDRVGDMVMIVDRATLE